MTELLAIILGLLAAFAMYIAAQSARMAAGPGDYLDAGRSLPGWTYIFAGSGVLLASLNPYDQMRLLTTYGFQANHLALSLILISLTAALFQKRLWLAAKITNGRTLGDIFGAYYQSTSIRIYLLVVLFLFAVPLGATILGSAGDILAGASGGAMTRSAAIFALAAFLFLFSALGGWRATIYVIAALSALFIVLLFLVTAFAGSVFDSLSIMQKGFTLAEGILPGSIPGVVQYSSGIGLEVPAGGLWTTTAILSFALAAAGVVLSPGFAFLGLTVKSRTGFAFSQVWITSGLAAGSLLLLGPVIAAEMIGADGFTELVGKFAAYDQLVATCLVVMLLSTALISVAFIATSSASIVTVEFLGRYVVPGLGSRDERLCAQIALATIYALIVLFAGFLPAIAEGLSALALPLSAQLLPAYLGLCWLPWISRSAVLVGLVLGSLFVLFTEPPGLIFFNGLFVELPWGRWPLTIHSAAWGLAINLSTCLLASIFTRKGDEHENRIGLHTIFHRDHRADFGSRATRSAKWSITLLWIFFALGPGAILGNTFFSQPVFSGAEVALGAPSLWVWQIAFWVMGVMIVWWLAFASRLSVIEPGAVRTGELQSPPRSTGKSQQPRWIAGIVTRLASRQNRTTRKRQ